MSSPSKQFRVPCKFRPEDIAPYRASFLSKLSKRKALLRWLPEIPCPNTADVFAFYSKFKASLFTQDFGFFWLCILFSKDIEGT